MTTGSNSASPFSKSWPTTIGKSSGWRARPLSRPKPPEAGIYGIDSVATEERNRLGLGDDPVLELRKLLEADVGLRIFALDLPVGIAGLYISSPVLGSCVCH